jgi:hypothetical protein
MGNPVDKAYFEHFMQPAEGTPACDKFFTRVEETGFTVIKSKLLFCDAEFDADEKTFMYDPESFTLFTLLHEKQHQVGHERALKSGIALRKLFNSKMMSVIETDAYCMELQVCERFKFPDEFTNVRRGLLSEYIHKARVALRNKEGLQELARQVLGYDIQLYIEQYLARAIDAPKK